MVSVSVDGEYPTVELLARRVTVNYGHFTSMQVRGHGVKGSGPAPGPAAFGVKSAA